MISEFARDFRRHRWNALGALLINGINRLFFIKILKGLVVETIDPALLSGDAAYVGRFLDSATLRSFAGNEEYELDADFLSSALAKGDECYGFLLNGELAAYSWYSRQPTAIDVPDLEMVFDPRYVYVYKCFVVRKHRGKRLNATGMARALTAYMSRGFSGGVLYAERTNLDSLTSCYRMGYRSFGSIYVIRFFGRFLSFSGRGCAQYSFGLEETVAPSEEFQQGAARR